MTFTVPLPEGIYDKDKFYGMNTDFKIWLKIDELIQSDLTDETKKNHVDFNTRIQKCAPR